MNFACLVFIFCGGFRVMVGNLSQINAKNRRNSLSFEHILTRV